MQSNASTPEAYINEVDPAQREALAKLREIFKVALEKQGFEEGMRSGMINYWVPYALYPSGYHCKPKQELPFLAIAAQKNFIAVYHLGLYANEVLLTWFTEAYPNYTSAKLDMGKSCIRFKKTGDIPYALFEALAEKISAVEWIESYERGRDQGRRGI